MSNYHTPTMPRGLITSPASLRFEEFKENPNDEEAADLTGNFLSFYFQDLQWYGPGCWKASKTKLDPSALSLMR